MAGMLLRLSLFLSFGIICYGKPSTNETAAQIWFEEYNSRSQAAHENYYTARWNYQTNITDYNANLSIKASGDLAKFNLDNYHESRRWNWTSFNDTLQRLFNKITDIGNAVLPKERNDQLNTIGSRLRTAYSTARLQSRPNRYYNLAELSRIIARSRHWGELEWAWKGWRDVSGKGMRDDYEQFTSLQNEAAKQNGFKDTGEHWRNAYETPAFRELCEQLWNEVKPLYEHLHTYVRRKLMEFYKGKGTFPDTKHIPAHLLGNMWSQSWANIMDIVIPYSNRPALDVTEEMINQGYDPLKMFQRSEKFFTSLGLQEMPQSFWNDSMIERPSDGRQVVCHASAWDFRNQKDFRIKQCTEVTMSWLMTTHHEMGHVAYYLAYKHLPVAFRRGGNPGFHEAVGDIMSLSVSTPDHLKTIGLLNDTIEVDNYTDINFLMRQALRKIAFLPFGYLIDQWRWSVFSGETTKENYNKKWWDLRCKYQGVSPPVPRSEEDFDPGAKNHIPGNTPYIRYFISNIIQFQFHEALCKAASRTGPLHRCDIFNSTEAGDRLKAMLSMGSSREWPDAMQAITGNRTMSAQSLKNYFDPLFKWLVKENNNQIERWSEECPSGSFVAPTTSTPAPTCPPQAGGPQLTSSLACVLLMLAFIMFCT